MVRRDADGRGGASALSRASACVASPAGGSPVPAGLTAPGSRSTVTGEIGLAEAGRQKPMPRQRPSGGEQARGPQLEVKPAASKDLQSVGRAAHFTAKATSTARASKLAVDHGGVWGAARVQGEARNTRDPSASPSSRQARPYKPSAKSERAQRESEGLVVPMMIATNNAIGGKGPCFGHARQEGKREGMAGTTGSNNPAAHTCGVQVRQPQRELWSRAKRWLLLLERREKRARGDARPCLHAGRKETPTQARSGRPSVSRVREIRTHGLKGGPALSSMTHII